MSVELLAAVVFAGAFAQAATGVGFGVVAGPCLLYAHGYEQGMTETAAFSLLVAAVTALALPARTDWRAVGLLTAGLPAGVALGLGVAAALSQSVILGTFGVLLVAMGLSLVRVVPPQGPTPTAGGAGAVLRAGIVAGAGAYLFAAPGPAAAWGLARAQLPPPAIRSTLAAYFVAAYGAILAAFACNGWLDTADWRGLALLAPVCIAGAVAGQRLGNCLSARHLRSTIGALVALSGAGLLATMMWGTT